jgi:broad specificity phosphatase PhoE
MAALRLGDPDVPLSSLGKRQLAFQMARKSDDFLRRPPQKILCSPLQRALCTAIAAYPDRKIIMDHRLREVGAAGGMTKGELRKCIRGERLSSKGKFDVRRIPRGKWWGSETHESVQSRVQGMLKEVQKTADAGKVVAVVAHSLLFQHMAGYPIKQFPRAWGSPRGWPQNFKPYFAKVKQDSCGELRLVSSSSLAATVVLVRHAHSAAQAARSAKNKRVKAREEATAKRKHVKPSSRSIGAAHARADKAASEPKRGLKIQRDNPKIKGSKAYKRFEKYRVARTVGQFFRLGGWRGDLRNDTERGYISIL